MNNMATSQIDLTTFLLGLRDLIDAQVGNASNGTAPAEDAPVKAKAGKGKAAKAAKVADPEPEPEEEDEAVTDPYAEYREELAGKSIKALRALAVKAGFDKAEVSEADEESIIESLIADRAETDAEGEDPEDDEDADDEGEAEGEEDEGDEGDEYTREDFEAMTLPALRKVAKNEYEVDAADLKGLDKDAIIDLLLGEGDEEEEEDEADDEDADEEEGYTEEDLKEMSLAELKALAKEWEVPVRAGAKSPTIIKSLMAAFAEADEEEDED